MLGQKEMRVLIAANYHTHCRFCDGAGEPRDFVEQAIGRGMKAIGFSSHAPLPFPNDWTMKDGDVQPYLDAIHALKREYHGEIEIYTGLEVDFFEDDRRRNIFKRYKTDYQIGAVHIFPDPLGDAAFSIDGTREEFEETLKILFAGDIESFVESYYRQLVAMLERHKPDILGHLDVIKKNNGDGIYFSEDDYWYRSAVLELLDVVKAKRTIVEVNTGGMIRGYTQEPYPSPWILAECQRREIPVMINSDAHAAEFIDAYFDQAAALLKEAGYTEHMVMLGGKWQAVEI